MDMVRDLIQVIGKVLLLDSLRSREEEEEGTNRTVMLGTLHRLNHRVRSRISYLRSEEDRVPGRTGLDLRIRRERELGSGMEREPETLGVMKGLCTMIGQSTSMMDQVRDQRKVLKVLVSLFLTCVMSLLEHCTDEILAICISVGSSNSHSREGHSPGYRDSGESYYGPSGNPDPESQNLRNSLYGGLANEPSQPLGGGGRTVDDRLNPDLLGGDGMLNDRAEAASLADDHDYSRRILR